MNERKDSLDLFGGSKTETATVPTDAQATSDSARQPTNMSVPATVGTRLRAAREAKGLEIADCARQLHLPVKVLTRLEADDFGDPQHFVFLRGALQGYARFLDLPPGSCDEALRTVAPVEQPALVSVARTSPARWLLQRYGTAAVYMVLTAFIVVPLVFIGLRGGLERPAPRVVSLDQAPAATAAPASTAAPARTMAVPDESPFRASMTPFAAIGLNTDGSTAGPAPVTPAPVPQAVAGQHTLTVAASADCWFEILDADGNKVDSGMLRAGDERSWHSDGPLRVTLGNADAVTVTSDGQPLPLDGFQRANVARFDVFAAPGGSGENG